jgi:mono/diheme cytochrome c family protein
MFSTSTLGVAFVVLGFGSMFLMYHLWGYPFDKETKKSAAPRWAMYTHRVLGYLFAITYVLLMIEMVPRLWMYQVEFPARTVVHMVVGFTIGFLLIVKISIMRFFRHFEEWMPYLGTAIMLGTVILLGLSLPFALHEEALAASAPGGSAFSTASQERVARLLPSAGMPDDVNLAELSTASSLRAGRGVLTRKCVVCHDLKTILDQPRTPAGWFSLVERMGDKPALFSPLSDQDIERVTAYLIAITPDLQKSRRQRREEAMARKAAMKQAEAQMTAMTAMAAMDTQAGGDGAAPPATDGTTPALPAMPAMPAIDLARAKMTYTDTCSQCHELEEVDAAPPMSADEAHEIIRRMITENEAELSADEIEQCHAYLVAHFVDKKI